MGAHATTQELIARANEQIIRLQAKANAEAISQLPEVMAFDKQIAELNNDALKWKRWATEATSKIVAFEKRVAEWKDRDAQSAQWLDNYKVEVADLKKQREAIVMAEAKKMV
jgi:hypothetical protein